MKKEMLILFVVLFSISLASAALSTSKLGNANVSGWLIVNKSINTTNGDICITGGNCLSGITVVASNTSNVAWSNITNFPDGCPANTFVTTIGDELTCAPVNSDSAYQWLQDFSSTNYVNITDNNDYSKNTTGEITYSIWINPDTFNFPGTGQGYVNYFSKTYYNSTDDDHFEFLFRMYNNTAVDGVSRSKRLSVYVFAKNTSLGVGSYYQNAADTNISAGNWIHVVGNINSTATRIYVNGVLRDTDTYSTTIQPVNTIAPLQIGAQPDNGAPNNYFPGKIDEVRIYNRSLSNAEIAELYTGGRLVNDSLVPTGLVFWLPMNETTGSPADASPKQHTGINNQGASWGFDGSSSSLDWTSLQNYPLSCDAGSYVSQIGDTITCTPLTTYAPITATYVVSNNPTEGDYSSIQDAINAAPSGALIHIKNGTYTVSGINITKSIIVQGEGTTATSIVYTGQYGFGVNNSAQIAQVIIRDMRINPSTPNQSVAINMSLMTVSKVENVWIGGITRPFYGFTLQGSGTHYNLIENARISVGGFNSTAIVINNTANENTILRTRIAGRPESVGIYCGAHANDFISVNVEGNESIGIWLNDNCDDTIIDGGYTENTATGLIIETTVEGTVIEGGFYADADDTANGNIIDRSGSSVLLNPRRQYEEVGIVSGPPINASGIAGGIITVNQGNITDVDNLFGRTADTLDLRSFRAFRLFPSGQTSIFLSVSNTTGALALSGGGTSNFRIEDSLNVTGALEVSSLTGTGIDYVCANANGSIFRSDTACA